MGSVMIKTNEEERQATKERLAEIRRWLMENPLLSNPMADRLIRESNILNVRLKMLGG